jgi:hypothetical protein
MKNLYRKNGIVKSKFLLVASKMPGESHWPDRSKQFDYRDSDVVKWLLDQPETWEWMFQKAHDLGMIIFDEDKKLWYGVDTEEGKILVEDKGKQGQAFGPLK